MASTSKYPNGYIEKINYWTGEYLLADNDMTKARCWEKIEFFMAKEKVSRKIKAIKAERKSKIEKLDLGNGNVIYGI